MLSQPLASAIPPERKRAERVWPKLTPEIKAFIDAFIDQVLIADRKGTDEDASPPAAPDCIREEKGSDVAAPTSGPTSASAGTSSARRPNDRPPVPFPRRPGEADFNHGPVGFPWGAGDRTIIAMLSEYSAASLPIALPTRDSDRAARQHREGQRFHGSVFPVLRLGQPVRKRSASTYLPQVQQSPLCRSYARGVRRVPDRSIARPLGVSFFNSFVDNYGALSPGSRRVTRKESRFQLHVTSAVHGTT